MNTIPKYKKEAASRISGQVEAFLASGGEIETVAQGVSGVYVAPAEQKILKLGEKWRKKQKGEKSF